MKQTISLKQQITKNRTEPHPTSYPFGDMGRLNLKISKEIEKEIEKEKPKALDR